MLHQFTCLKIQLAISEATRQRVKIPWHEFLILLQGGSVPCESEISAAGLVLLVLDLVPCSKHNGKMAKPSMNASHESPPGAKDRMVGSPLHSEEISDRAGLRSLCIWQLHAIAATQSGFQPSGAPGRLSSQRMLVTTLGSSKRHALLRVLGVLSHDKGARIVGGTVVSQPNAKLSPRLQTEWVGCSTSAGGTEN